MYLIRQPWKYDFVETDEGLLIIEKGEISQMIDGVIELDDMQIEVDVDRKKPWTFMLDGMEHLYR